MGDVGLGYRERAIRKGVFAATVRAAQVFAYLLTRGDEQFLKYFLSAPRATIERWLTRFRSFWRHSKGGRPRVKVDIEGLVVTFSSREFLVIRK